MGGSSGVAGEGRSASPHVVNFRRREMVAPAVPTTRHSYYLSCFDIVFKRVPYNRKLLFYESTALSEPGTDGQSTGSITVERLKSSLALCLVHYYPWCGRLSRPAGERLSIDCNDAGVEFVEASIPHLPISYLSSQGFQRKPFFEDLCAHLDHSGDRLYSSPLLSVQVTHFSDNGLALGIALSHVVADGHAFWNFMVSWGECARGRPLSVPPVLERELLALPNPSLNIAECKLSSQLQQVDFEDFEEDQEERQEELHVEGAPTLSAGAGGGDSAGTPTFLEEAAIVSFVFKLPASAVKRLKEEDGGIHSTYEVTSAHIWQRFTVARQRPLRDPTVFFVVMQCRTRLEPALPSAYFGNAVVLGAAVSRSGTISRESLHGIASRIHEVVVETARDDTLRKCMHWLETHDHEHGEQAQSKLSSKALKFVRVAGSAWFPAYEVDFGWGKPMAVRSPNVRGNGAMFCSGAHPNDATGGLEFFCGLPGDVLRRLLADPLFLGQAPGNPFEDV